MRRIEIYDTTLRDGAQGEGIDFSLEDKLQLTARLDDLGIDYVEGGYPASNEKDLEYFRSLGRLGLKRVKVAAFGMTRRKNTRAEDDAGLQTLLDANTPVVTIVGKSSGFQVTEVLQTTRDENLAMIRESLGLIARAGREVIFDAEHFFDGWKCDAGYALATLRAAVEGGARRLVLCDTNGGTMPDSVAAVTREVVAALDPVPVGVHCHNDCDLAVANSLAAIDAGASHVHGTINGFGERCGNADLISVMGNLACKKQGFQILVPGGLEHLTELSRFVYEMVNQNFRFNQPFVGKSAFAHKGGMHVSGVSRVTASYEHIAPGLVGNERRILVSELSGRSNIIARTTRHKLGKKVMEEILAQVVSLENAGYQFEAADGSFDLLVRRSMGTFRPHFELVKYHVNVENGNGGNATTLATVKIRIPTNGEIRHEVAEGDGPVNALDNAMRKALNGEFPALRKMRLVDYKVRVINSQAATAAGVRVVIESQDEDDVWGTVGVSENIIQASWQALTDSYEYKLWKDHDKRVAT